MLTHMTGRTHDLIAFTAMNFVFITQPVGKLSLATVAVSFGANMIGGLLPDIDNATSDIWDKIRFGNLLSRLIRPLIGGHRMISHSVLGMAVAGFIINRILGALQGTLVVDMNAVWWAAMIGYLSHLIADSFTTEGVPWLFPLPVRIGFPPAKSLRIRTGGFIENVVLFPALFILNGYFLYTNYGVYFTFFRSYIVQ